MTWLRASMSVITGTSNPASDFYSPQTKERIRRLQLEGELRKLRRQEEEATTQLQKVAAERLEIERAYARARAEQQEEEAVDEATLLAPPSPLGGWSPQRPPGLGASSSSFSSCGSTNSVPHAIAPPWAAEEGAAATDASPGRIVALSQKTADPGWYLATEEAQSDQQLDGAASDASRDRKSASGQSNRVNALPDLSSAD